MGPGSGPSSRSAYSYRPLNEADLHIIKVTQILWQISCILLYKYIYIKTMRTAYDAVLFQCDSCYSVPTKEDSASISIAVALIQQEYCQ